MDFECPNCGRSRKDGFDIGVDSDTGEIFGARCGNENGGCGWSF